MNILHAVGWGLLAFIGMFFFIVLLCSFSKTKVSADFTRGVLQISFITGIAVFLLTL